MPFISITGLKFKHFWLIVHFYRYAIPSFMQAKKAKGVLFAEVRRVLGVEHTLTVWKSRSDMQRFLYSGILKRAIASFRSIATGSTFGYESNIAPTCDEAIQRWKTEGREY